MPSADNMKELMSDRIIDDIGECDRGVMCTNLYIIFLRDIHDIHMCPLENDGRCVEQSLSVAIWIHPALAVTRSRIFHTDANAY